MHTTLADEVFPVVPLELLFVFIPSFARFITLARSPRPAISMVTILSPLRSALALKLSIPGKLKVMSSRRRLPSSAPPSYGFLSENEHFAKAVEDAGLVFIGPPAHSIRDMGSKSASKNIMEKCGALFIDSI